MTQNRNILGREKTLEQLLFNKEYSIDYYQREYNLGNLVDLSELPDKNTPIYYPDFSIVDSAGFSKNPDTDMMVKEDPRKATEKIGKEIFEKIVQKFLKITKNALKK